MFSFIDIGLTEQGRHLGGCAFNIALMLKRFGIDAFNLLPVGQGSCSMEIQKLLNKHQMTTLLDNLEGDNGWCMALVEPDGERTFLTVSGVGNEWSIDLLKNIDVRPNALIYLVGYQLTSKKDYVLLDLLESLTGQFTVFLDLGPRIKDLSKIDFLRLMKLLPILSVNRQEAEFLGFTYSQKTIQQDLQNFMQSFYTEYSCPIVVRLDKDGAASFDENGYFWSTTFPTKIANSIGAGDNHAAAMLAALSNNWPLSEALILGNAVASYVVGQHGANSYPNKEQLIKHIC